MSPADELEDIKRNIKVRVPIPHRFTERSLCGNSLSILKSALQKAIRRGQTYYACQVAMDVWLWTVHGRLVFDQMPKSWSKQQRDAEMARRKALRKEVVGNSLACVTNMKNRLNLIIAEDVGMANPYLPNALRTQLQLWNSDDMERRGSLQGLQYLLDIVTACCESGHSRLVSYMNNMYFSPRASAHHKLKYPERFVGPWTTFKSALKGGSFLALKFAQDMQQDEVWDDILDVAARQTAAVSQVVQWLKSRYKRTSPRNIKLRDIKTWVGEGNVYYVQAMLTVIYHVRGDHPQQALLRPNVFTHSPRSAVNILGEFLSKGCFTIPDEARDMHSDVGRRMGRSRPPVVNDNSPPPGKEVMDGIVHFIDHGTRMFKEVRYPDHAFYKRAYQQYKFHQARQVWEDRDHLTDYDSDDNLPLAWLHRRKGPPSPEPPLGLVSAPNVFDEPPEDDVDGRVHFNELSHITKTRDVTCGGKPMSFFAKYHGMWMFLKPGEGMAGRLQLLADSLKPLFGLRAMGVSLVACDFGVDSNRIRRSNQTQTFIMCPKAEGTSLSRERGWQHDGNLCRQYVLIGLFRYGTYRFTDFNTSNVLKLKNEPTLLSIDECGIGRQQPFPANQAWVHEYVVQHRRQLEHKIHKWQEVVHRQWVDIVEIVQSCGLDKQVALDVKKNINDLTPFG